jgi:SAM-dependent methyltransferase
MKLKPRIKELTPAPVWQSMAGLRRRVKRLFRSLSRDPSEVVKANTQEAFDFFWDHDEYINRCFLNQDRLDFLDTVADYCVQAIIAPDPGAVIRIVDIGCGSGHLLHALKRRLISKCEVDLFGLDFSSVAIRKARALLPMATFVVEDICDNSLPAASFDLVLCLETVEHLRRPEEALRELLRVCRAGGSVVITVPNAEKEKWDGHVQFWDRVQFHEFLAPYGLVEMRSLRLWQEDMVLLAHLVK